MNKKKPLWKIPEMWLVIGIPLASVVAGLGLVVFAVTSGGADTVRDEVRRVSQIQTSDLGPDARASALKLKALLRNDAGVLEVIPSSGDFPKQKNLRLVLGHPTQAQEDVRVELVPAATGWRGVRTLDADHDWVVELTPEDGEWRLHGRLPKGQRAILLAPSLTQ
jgi:hypothetical protein